MVDYAKALEEALVYFKGDSLAANVFLGKYALKNPKGDILEPTPKYSHMRLAKEFARIEAKYPNPMPEDEIFSLLDQFKYIIPQGSPMAGIGNEHQIQSLSNCFVISTGDSYGAIMKTDEELAQIFKRRGGCVEEDTKVFTEDKGLQLIREVKIGQRILSYNLVEKRSEFKTILDKFPTEVAKFHRIIVETTAGIQIKTSKLHPILVFNPELNKLIYKKAGDIKEGDCLVQPERSIEPNSFSTASNEVDLGWFIGAHIGDGSAGAIKVKYRTAKRSWNVNRTRLRILGDNKTVVERYGKIANSLLGSDSKDVFLSGRKSYKTSVWEYVIQTKAVAELVDHYFDGKIGQKVYDAATPTYVKNNNLWIPYIAGLIDTDGHIRPEGTIQIAICAKSIIDDVASWLSVMGVRTHTKYHIPSRKNEHPIWKLSIRDHTHPVVQEIMTHVVHENKISRFNNCHGREFSRTYPLSYSEKEEILSKYNEGKYKSNFSRNLLACIHLVRNSSPPQIGMGSLNVFESFGLIQKTQINQIKQRVIVKSIKKDLESQKYYDLVVADNNNYYAGNFGMVVDHNCGTDISPIRPKGMKTTNAAGTTTGIGPFMERFSNTCREVGQEGRRGAEMQTISVHHPEIRTFINIKRDKTKVTGANISIRLSDEFMNAVKNGTDFELRWPVDSASPKVREMVDAKSLWKEIISSARDCAEPGILFWDNVLRNSPADSYAKEGFRTVSTNPCSELPLAIGDACRLMVVNVMPFVASPFTIQAKFEWEKFRAVVDKAQRLMDDVVDLELECIDRILAKVESDPEDISIKIREKNLWEMIRGKCSDGRRTGLGVTAIGDMIAAMGMTYGSEDSIAFVEQVYKTLCLASYRSSVNLAKERGAFPIWNAVTEQDNEFLKRVWEADNELYQDCLKYGRRNIANLTTAPVGSMSLLAWLNEDMFQTTSGIECAYKALYKRRKKINPNDKEARVDLVDEMGDKWQEFVVKHPGFQAWMEINKKTENDIALSPYHQATAMDLTWLNGVKLQAAAQRWVDHAISRTQNLPNDVSEDTVSEIYMAAWEYGCKGFTVYREGSRSGVLVSLEETPKPVKKEDIKFENRLAPKRPQELECDVYHSQVQGEKWTIFIGKLEGKPYEVMGGLAKFVNIPKRVRAGKIVKHNGEINPARYDFHYDFDKGEEDECIIRDIGNIFENPINSAFTRTISLNLRHGVPVQYICEQLVKGAEKESDLFSFSKGMSRVLKNYILDGTKTSQKVCPDCKSTNLSYQQGCVSCLDCGSSKCS